MSRVDAEPTDDNYIVVRVAEGTAELGEHHPKAVADALMRVLTVMPPTDHENLPAALVGADEIPALVPHTFVFFQLGWARQFSAARIRLARW